MNKCFKRIAAIFSVIAIIGATFMGCGKVNNKRTESTNLILSKTLFKAGTFTVGYWTGIFQSIC